MLWCLAMSAIRTDELMAELRLRGGPFPQKDHFHATLAPWKDRLDENALFVLTAALRKSDRGARDWWPRRWLAGWHPLRAAARARHARPRAPLHQRAAAAAAIQEYSRAPRTRFP